MSLHNKMPIELFFNLCRDNLIKCQSEGHAVTYGSIWAATFPILCDDNTTLQFVWLKQIVYISNLAIVSLILEQISRLS